ncbi:peptidoglycan-binding domain-containing protein [Labrenzia sp. 011]|uniref:peptidoglycan-binding domain-containing protein n=1 Tax=Labrenzia sp. 011 TaxID=2171494 RepID=UPI0014038D76|nr:peptidoglycan-binding domain-containing protein [Labrenzia sp. 011]
MRAVLMAVLVLLVSTGTSLADYNDSKSWFHGMAYEQRIRTQFLLVFTGDYDGPVDGAFGRLTYKGLTAFQKHREYVPDGILDPRQMLVLQRDGLDLVRRVGFETMDETASGLTLGVPVKLFEPATPSGRGRHWLAHDRSIELETWRVPRQETGYRALYRRLTRPREGRVVEHSSFRNDHFIVSGRQDGRDFYLRVMKSPRDSRGFSLFWNPKHAVFMDRVAVAMSSSMTGIMEQEESRPNDTMDTPDQMSPPPENEDLNAAVPPPGTVTSRSTGSGTGS